MKTPAAEASMISRHFQGQAIAALALTLFLGTTASGQTVFEDRFDGRLGEGWTWLRENPGAWHLHEGALEIRVEPGVADTVRNALLREAPDRGRGTYAIEVVVTNTVRPTRQYEQAGITWYCGGKPVFKLVKELIDGDLYIIPGKVPMASESVRLRLTVTAESFKAEFQPDGKGDFLQAAAGSLPPPEDDRVSIQCYNGPDEGEHWIRFDDFRVVKVDER
jgi:hypothetical protein